MENVDSRQAVLMQRLALREAASSVRSLAAVAGRRVLEATEVRPADKQDPTHCMSRSLCLRLGTRAGTGVGPTFLVGLTPSKPG
jgi:hypothetical protein